MYRTARRAALCPLSGIQTVRPPRGGWHRQDPGDGGGDDTGHSNAGGAGTNDGGSDGDGDGKAGDKTPKIKGDLDPDRAAAAIASARAGETKAKQDAKDAKDRLAAVLKAAGLTPDGKADPEEHLKATVARAEAAEKKAAALARREAVRDAAATHKANAGELLDSQKFAAQLDELDPTADDYADLVGALVKKAVKEHPSKYGAAQGTGAGRSGSGDHTGGSGGQERPKSIREALQRKYQH